MYFKITKNPSIKNAILSKAYTANASNKVKNDNYQYIQNSKVPTMHFQPSLPRLPIPELQNSGKRYLNALQPLLSSNDFDEATKTVHNFMNNEGKNLQQMLIQKDKKNKHTSYICEYWFDLYLRDRAPLPINYNPLVVFQNDSRPEYNNQLIRASNLLISSVRFMLAMRENILEPEVYHMNAKKSDTDLFRLVSRMLPSSLSWYGAYAFKAFPLDMSQFSGLFGATRIPEIGKDKILRDNQSKHVVVQRRGNFYTFDVLDTHGNLLEPSQILSRVKYILSDDTTQAEHPLGVLTCQDRDLWAKQRKHLEDIGNKEALHSIDTAIFNLVLDDEVIDGDKHKVLKTFLHSDGTNRWFDKSFSLIVTGDGVSGVNFEHSWGDGVAVLRYFQDIYKETTTKPWINPDMEANEKDVSSHVKKLTFNVDDKVKDSVRSATEMYKSWCDTLSIDYILYEGLTKEACKQYKVSPDCIMQLSFQAAYHLLHGKYVGTYESCSTSAFKHGRTETMRPCTVHTKEFCDALHSTDRPSNDVLQAMLQKCSTNHSQLTKEAALGQGFDRHLFALRKIAEENSIPDPALFQSEQYKFLNTSILSTSTLSSPAVMAGGFGPVATKGFGIGYSAFANMLGAAVASYKPHNNSSEFVDALNQSFIDITRILMK